MNTIPVKPSTDNTRWIDEFLNKQTGDDINPVKPLPSEVNGAKRSIHGQRGCPDHSLDTEDDE